MRRVKKITDVKIENIEFFKGYPVMAKMQSIRHSKVHIHKDVLELLFCIKGSVNVLCNHEIVEIKEGEIFTVNYDDVHCVYSDKDNLILNVFFDLTNLEEPLETLLSLYIACEDVSVSDMKKRYLEEIKCMILSLALRMFKDEIELQEVKKIASNIIGKMEMNFDWLTRFDAYPSESEEFNSRIKTVYNYCCNNYQERITISKAAKQLNINENYFSQFFKKSPYGGFSKMLGFIRCFVAQIPLLGSEMTITQISEQCGFSDEKYFYKNFRFWWCKTPSEYRAWFREYVKKDESIDVLSQKESVDALIPYIADYFSKVFTKV